MSDRCPLGYLFFNIIQFILKVFRNFTNINLSSAFLALYGLKMATKHPENILQENETAFCETFEKEKVAL